MSNSSVLEKPQVGVRRCETDDLVTPRIIGGEATERRVAVVSYLGSAVGVGEISREGPQELETDPLAGFL